MACQWKNLKKCHQFIINPFHLSAAVKATAMCMSHLIYRDVRYGKKYIDRGTETYELRLHERTMNSIIKHVMSHVINSSEISATFTAA